MNPKIGTKFLRGRLHTSEQRLRWLQKSLAKLEQRQQKGFNKNRQHAINRLREQLAMVAVEDGGRPAANRQRVNTDISEDAFAVTGTAIPPSPSYFWCWRANWPFSLSTTPGKSPAPASWAAMLLESIFSPASGT